MVEQKELLDKLAAIAAGDITEADVCRHWLRCAPEALTDIDKKIDSLRAQEGRLEDAFHAARRSFCMGPPDVAP